jgi:hypothetical protein
MFLDEILAAFDAAAALSVALCTAAAELGDIAANTVVPIIPISIIETTIPANNFFMDINLLP